MKNAFKYLFSILPSFSVLLWSAALPGCTQVRLVRDASDGGIVAIPNNTNQWPTYYRNRAASLMKRKCPEGYVIVGEQVAEDNPAARDNRKPNEDFDYEGGYIRVTTYNRKEYRITFRSAAAASPPPATAKPLAPPATSPPPVNEELPPPRPMPAESPRMQRAGGVSDGG